MLIAAYTSWNAVIALDKFSCEFLSAGMTCCNFFLRFFLYLFFCFFSSEFNFFLRLFSESLIS